MKKLLNEAESSFQRTCKQHSEYDFGFQEYLLPGKAKEVEFSELI